MTQDQTQLTEAELASLVSYLDGELTGDARQEIEQRAARDPDYRRHLVELEQSWNLLDRLPSTEVDHQFTNSTVSMAAMAAVEPRRNHWLSSRVTRAALALALGFLLLALPRTLQRRAALKDLPVIDSLDLYLYADSLEFLQLLDEEGIFEEATDAI